MVRLAGLVVRLERTGRPACLDFLGPLIEICDVIACLSEMLAGLSVGIMLADKRKGVR
jgi:hypothetical protein